MVAINYKPFVERMIFRYEGNYGWDAKDPGGPTKFGITCYDLAEFLGEKMTSMSAWAPRVKAMALATADTIYERKYATACRFNDVEAGSDCVIFDFGVNSGPSRAVKYAQGIVGAKRDGLLGPITLQAINAYDAAAFINALCDERLAFMRNLPTWPRFRGGWTARVADLRHYSLALLPKPTMGLMAELEDHIPEEKEFRIPLAFAKAHDDVPDSAVVLPATS